MKNKQVKQMICDVFNTVYDCNSELKYVWLDEDKSPCLICFKSANFMWPRHGVRSLTAEKLKK